MFSICWALGGWDHEAGEPIIGGVHLDEVGSLAEALELAPAFAVVAGRKHGEGCVVILDEDGSRVDRPAPLRPVSVGYRCGL